jgi:hypothetical protein
LQRPAGTNQIGYGIFHYNATPTDHDSSCNSNFISQSYPDKPFCRWVTNQRYQYTLKLRCEKNDLTDEREAKLKAIGFSWVAPGFSKKTVQMTRDEKA